MKRQFGIILIMLLSSSWSLILKHHSLINNNLNKNHKFDNIINNIIENKFHTSDLNQSDNLQKENDGSPVERGLLEINPNPTPHQKLNQTPIVKHNRSLTSKCICLILYCIENILY